MSKNDRIKARAASESKRLKSPTSAVDQDIDYPVFCFRHVAQGYRVVDCTASQSVSLLEKLSKMSQQSWQDLMTSSHWSGAGFESIPLGQIHAPMPSIVTEDVSKLLVMRYGGTDHRLLGLRSGPVFHITHIDPTRSTYSH